MVKDDDSDTLAFDIAEKLCNAANGGDMDKLAEAFYQAFTRQHRYLQNEVFIFLWKFFAKYRHAQCDARNEHSVATAGRWYDSFFSPSKN
jgi:hypothetical protein